VRKKPSLGEGKVKSTNGESPQKKGDSNAFTVDIFPKKKLRHTSSKGLDLCLRIASSDPSEKKANRRKKERSGKGKKGIPKLVVAQKTGIPKPKKVKMG